MELKDIKLGDRVIYKNPNTSKLHGSIATVIAIDYRYEEIYIEFDDNFGPRNLSRDENIFIENNIKYDKKLLSKCKVGHGRATVPEFLTLYKRKQPKYSKHIAQLNFDESLNENNENDILDMNGKKLKVGDKVKLKDEEGRGIGIIKRIDGTLLHIEMPKPTTDIEDREYDYIKKGHAWLSFGYAVERVSTKPKYSKHIAQLKFEEFYKK